MYIRMYELCNFNILLISYLHLKIFNKKEISYFDITKIGISCIIGGLTHYYFFVYLLVIYLGYNIKCLKKKQYKNLKKYNLGMFIAGVIYLLIFPYSINHVLFGYRGVEQKITVEQLIKNAGTYISILNKELYRGVFLLILILTTIISKLKTKKTSCRNKKVLNVLFYPAIIYLIVVIINSPYQELRYIIPIYSVLTIVGIWYLHKCVKLISNSKTTMFFVIFTCFLLIYCQGLINRPIEYTYSNYKGIVQNIENARSIPCIYIFNTENNRFLDDIYLFTIVENSYIMEPKDVNNLQEICKEINLQNGMLVFINEGIRRRRSFTGNKRKAKF